MRFLRRELQFGEFEFLGTKLPGRQSVHNATHTKVHGTTAPRWQLPRTVRGAPAQHETKRPRHWGGQARGMHTKANVCLPTSGYVPVLLYCLVIIAGVSQESRELEGQEMYSAFSICIFFSTGGLRGVFVLQLGTWNDRAAYDRWEK